MTSLTLTILLLELFTLWRFHSCVV